MLGKNLYALEDLPRIPFIADKGYDAVDVIESYKVWMRTRSF
jgi:hypothetical protein